MLNYCVIKVTSVEKVYTYFSQSRDVVDNAITIKPRTFKFSTVTYC